MITAFCADQDAEIPAAIGKTFRFPARIGKEQASQINRLRVGMAVAPT
ncbi:hypothetical protein JQ628_12400 [Bradyrhizobium lablabi]|nr:hypothetical protein [Bradyrhizobium lablabi]MBR1122318.1 hypothetical protein [Bradyrhizobium lablabi]